MAFIDRDPARWATADYHDLRDACIAHLRRPQRTADDHVFDAYALLTSPEREVLIERIIRA